MAVNGSADSSRAPARLVVRIGPVATGFETPVYGHPECHARQLSDGGNSIIWKPQSVAHANSRQTVADLIDVGGDPRARIHNPSASKKSSAASSRSSSLAGSDPCPISVDTTKAEVARQAWRREPRSSTNFGPDVRSRRCARLCRWGPGSLPCTSRGLHRRCSGIPITSMW